MNKKDIQIQLNDVTVNGILTEPDQAKALVLFAHGSGSSRLSPGNNYVAEALNKRNITTLLADLLNPYEDERYENRFDIPLLTKRLIQLTEHVLQESSMRHLPAGYFGASTGAACALQAAAILEKNIKVVVSRGGRPDLAKGLQQVKAPTLLIIGSLDGQVMELNREAFAQLRCEKKMATVEGATHLFEEPGALHTVAELAAGWFEDHFSGVITSTAENR